MDVANSSMYDGMTSFAEACILAFSQTKKNKIVVSKGLHYQALQVLHTYAKTRKEFSSGNRFRWHCYRFEKLEAAG